MNAIRDQIIARLDHLNEAQATKVLQFIETVEEEIYSAETDPMLNGELLFSGSPNLSEEELPEYDEANDPLIGFFSGPPDLAERSEEIL